MGSATKNAIRDLCPPIVWRAGKKLVNSRTKTKIPLFAGSFSTWEEAAREAESWSHKAIVSHVKDAAHRAKNGEIEFERDARPASDYQWPILSALNRILAERNGRLRLLDFGGSLGSLYFQCRPLLASDASVEWRIIEQGEIARIGEAEFENDELSFFNSIDDALENDWHPDAILLSGSLQYQRNAYGLLEVLLSLGADYFLLDRTTFLSDELPDRVTVQHITEMNYGRYLRLPQWLFNRTRFIDMVSDGYEIIAEFSSVDPTAELGDCAVYHRGLIAKRKEPS